MHTHPLLPELIKRFRYYKELGERAMNQLPDEALFWQYNEESNSIAIIVNHLHGNMLSRWTNFLTEDGEKPWRTRDAEFENEIQNREQLRQKWEEGWDCLLKALENLKEEDLSRKVFIRSEAHTVSDAIFRQLAHYAYHIGQMVFLAKMTQNEDWQTLSIARGKSKEYRVER